MSPAMTDTNPGGWIDAARPGYPANPERDGVHWLGSGPGRVFVALWNASVRCWFFSGDDRFNKAGDVAACNDYIGPCHTPAEVAALVDAARREGEATERDACIAACRKAVPRAHTYASENADIYRAGDVARDRCIEAIGARGDA
jgi:hypothetical protein